MPNSVYIDPGPAVALDRPSLSAPAPQSVERLLELCESWASEVGWHLADEPVDADGVVLGPEVASPDTPAEVVRTQRGQGIDGFRWAIRHLAYSRQWPFETVSYGLIPDQEMDVRRPRRSRRGVAVLLHGGFWMDAWRRDLMEGIAVDLAQQGWESYNVEYGMIPGTGGWPQTGEDVLAALEGVVEAADGDAVALVGHSAGAQLALWAAAQRPETVTCVVSLAGLWDLEEARRLRLGSGAVERFLGDQPANAASPVDHAGHDAVAVLVHCEGDTVVPVDQSRRYTHAATATGSDVHLQALPGGDHMALIEPDGLWPVARDALINATSRAR